MISWQVLIYFLAAAFSLIKQVLNFSIDPANRIIWRIEYRNDVKRIESGTYNNNGELNNIKKYN